MWILVWGLVLPQVAAAGLFGFGSADTAFVDKASVVLEKRVNSGASPSMKRLYKELFYTPVWISEKKPTKFARVLIDRIKNDKTVAPNLKCCKDLRNIEKEMKELYSSANASLDRKIDLELRMSGLYLEYMRYILYGGIDWAKFDEKRKSLAKLFDSVVGWDYYRPKMTPASLLAEATVSGDLNAAFDKAEPRRFKYRKLKKYLIRYMELANNGGWGKLPRFTLIKPGQSSKAIPAIRRHLAMEGDLGACRGDMASEVYDECLQKAIKKFKLRHGLHGTSIIDTDTRRALSIPVEKKIRMIRLNMDRIKWLWRDEARVRIELNIPAFRLFFYDGKHLVDTMRVIVGKPNHPTPSFHDVMEYLIVNPYWKIPESIVKKEMLGHLIADPYYYERRGKIVRSSWSEDSPRVDPGTVDWSQYRGKKHIPYYFMQLPSSRNALGKIKFLFPNRFSVYIHDTPTKKLFFKNQRAFSHGCMRIQKPREMLKALSLYNDNIDVEEIMSLLTTTKKKTIVLKHKIPVDITYLTAFVDDYGYLNFRRDVYKYDKYQLEHYAYGVYAPAKSETTGDKTATDRRSGARKEVGATESETAPPVKKSEKDNKTKQQKMKTRHDFEKKVKNKKDRNEEPSVKSSGVASGDGGTSEVRSKKVYRISNEKAMQDAAAKKRPKQGGVEAARKETSAEHDIPKAVGVQKGSTNTNKDSRPGQVSGVQIMDMTSKNKKNKNEKPVIVIEARDKKSDKVETRSVASEKKPSAPVVESETKKKKKSVETNKNGDSSADTIESERSREDEDKKIKSLMRNLGIE